MAIPESIKDMTVRELDNLIKKNKLRIIARKGRIVAIKHIGVIDD